MIEDKNIQNAQEEIPTIIIERVDDEPAEVQQPREVTIIATGGVSRWKKWAVVAIILGLLAAVAVLLFMRRQPTKAPLLPVSITSAENIEILQQPVKSTKACVVVAEDSINDVLFRTYTLKGLRAELSMTEPKESDRSVYLYARSADYRADNGQVLDACVINGEELSTGDNRCGYFASVGKRAVIGIAYDDDVLQFAKDNAGCFFRQFALVSDGQIGDIRLRGKVERRALARRGTTGDLVYVESLNAESLYDFAQALADYGFTDAIYMTGGKYYSFYRDANGQVQPIGESGRKGKVLAPFIVFRKG